MVFDPTCAFALETKGGMRFVYARCKFGLEIYIHGRHVSDFALVSGVGAEGDYYIVTVSGTINLDGISSWSVGDSAIFASGSWVQVTRTDLVISVNSNQGVVVLDTDNINEGISNLYYTENRVTGNVDVAANTVSRHTHSNKAILDAITDEGSGQVITTIERGRLLTQNEKNAIVGTSGSVDTANRFVTDIDPRLISGSALVGNIQYYNGTKWQPLAAGVSGSFLHGKGAAAPNWLTPALSMKRIALVTPDGSGFLTFSDSRLATAKTLLVRVNTNPSGSANSRIILRINGDATARYAWTVRRGTTNQSATSVNQFSLTGTATGTGLLTSARRLFGELTFAQISTNAIHSIRYKGGFVGQSGPTVAPTVVESIGAYYPLAPATIASLQIRMEGASERVTSNSFMEIWILS